MAPAINSLPKSIRTNFFVAAGRSESLSAHRLPGTSVEDICRWVTRQYPNRRYPAVAIGSANGAAIHLFAALGIPWLPQTFLIPVARSGIAPDDAAAELHWGIKIASGFLRSNREINLHHMQDPIQDRLMVRAISYFRIKKISLGPAYEQFLTNNLERNGVVLLIECQQSWPVVRVSDRHFFQFGAMGDASPEEYYHGSERVWSFLEKQGGTPSDWSPPKPDMIAPEAEWGFEPKLAQDAARFAEAKQCALRRISFNQPEELSELAARFYRQCLIERGRHPAKLLIESFILLEPHWVLRSGAIPYWTVFSTHRSLRRALTYLADKDARADFDEIFIMLFPHGVQSVGLASPSDWEILGRSLRATSRFIGVDRKAYPQDFAAFLRYHHELWQIAGIEREAPAPVPLERFISFVEEQKDPKVRLSTFSRRERAS